MHGHCPSREAGTTKESFPAQVGRERIRVPQGRQPRKDHDKRRRGGRTEHRLAGGMTLMKDHGVQTKRKNVGTHRSASVSGYGQKF